MNTETLRQSESYEKPSPATQGDRFQEAQIFEWQFKTPAMRRMTVDVCRLALARPGGEFSALDLPKHGEEEQGGSGIAGSVFTQLVKAGILAPVGEFVRGEFYQRRVRNAGGNPVGVWRLQHGGKARLLVQVHGGPAPELKQAELLPAAVTMPG